MVKPDNYILYEEGKVFLIRDEKKPQSQIKLGVFKMLI
ncbi:hypothetical protein BAZSYMB_GCONTIG00764_0 [Bathymodiolus azoricus thioautotrophic gill symbiont]|uniref:Uncharacterized protein n=1 Tax=Bathymodiolus azoricus thioautotrophic gill symbiont TaxID=235205 RepID=A0A1H6LNZ8_9GAMM|nr:hypothetical protein BAZSYMB_GCONTIG00764_0 [Bathymodiolus azoricus thioautotrophic gill symbiont]